MNQRALLFTILMGLVACNRPDVEADGIECGPHQPCAAEYACGGDGRCHMESSAWAGPPATIIDLPPPGATTTTSVTVAFLAPAVDVQFECRVDDGAYAACTSPATLDVTPGEHSVTIRSVDARGMRGAETVRTFTAEAAGPPAMIDSEPPDGAVTRATTATIRPSSSAAGATFECSVDQGAFVACAPPLTLMGLAEGAHTVVVRASRGGSIGAETSVAWTVDLTPPAVRVTRAPAGVIASGSASVEFSADEAARCALDGAEAVACTSPRALEGLVDGEHTLVVIARDTAGNEGRASASFVVDTRAPTVKISAGPADPSSAREARFVFAASDGATRCSLDGGSPTPCASPWSVANLTDGPHMFTVEARDDAGNAGVATRSWTVDASAPSVAITSAPPTLSRDASAIFTFAADGATTCAVDAKPPAPCTSPVGTGKLADGPHVFTVATIDAAGNAAAARHTWTIDTLPPAVAFSSTPASPSASKEATFVFSGEQTSCSLDGEPAAPCTSPRSFTLDEGSHTLVVTARDPAGNEASASHSWVIDTSAPVVTILQGPPMTSDTSTATFTIAGDSGGMRCAIDGGEPKACASPYTVNGLADGAHTFEVSTADSAGNTASDRWVWTIALPTPHVAITGAPPAATSSTSATIAFTADDGAIVTCALDAAAAAPCASPVTFDALSEGTHTLRVEATAEGKTGVASAGWEVDTTAPSVTLSGPADPSASPSARFTFSAGGEPTRCALDGAVPAACTSPADVTLADGPHTFTVTARDAAGNQDEATWSFSVDTVAPSVSIGGPPSLGNDPSVTFSITRDGGTLACALDGAAATPCASPLTIDDVLDGPHVFMAQATDAAGNVGSATYLFTIDTDPPTLTASGPPDPSASTSATFTFSAQGAIGIRCSLDGAPAASCSSPTIVTGLGEGRHDFSVEAFDAAGNADTRSLGWVVDTTAPIITIQGPKDPSNSRSATFTFNTGGGTSPRCSLDGATPVLCASGVTVSNLTDADHAYTVTARDAAGNVGSSTYRWKVDTAPPTVTITGAPPSPARATSATVTFSTAEPVTLGCQLDGGSVGPCDSATSMTVRNLAPGKRTLVVLATDAAGNVGSQSVSWLVTFCVAPSGSDSNAGNCDAPGRTLTRALSRAPAGDIVYAAPGRYDPAGGETLPLTVPKNVSLIGDEAAKGAAATPTTIFGSGSIPGTAYLGTLLPQTGSTVAGFTISDNASFSISIFTNGQASVTIRNNTIDGAADALWIANNPGHVITGNVITNHLGYALQTSASGQFSNNVVTRNGEGVSTSGSMDLSGGNRFSCNSNDDIQGGAGLAIIARNNFWDHVPPSSKAVCSAGTDFCNPNGGGSLDSAGAALAPGACP